MFCPKCHSELQETVTFCPNCGLDLQENAPVAEGAAKKPKAIGAVSTVLGVIALISSICPIIMDIVVRFLNGTINGLYINGEIEAAEALSIVVGLISILSLGAFAVAAILSIASLITGIIAKKKGAGAAGLVLSIIAVILCALMGAVSAVEFFIGFVKGFVNGLNMGMGGI